MSDRTRKPFFITALLVIACGFAAVGRLINTPENQSTFLDGTNISMSCSSTLGSDSITWFLLTVSDGVNVTIASGSTVSTEFIQLYWIDQPTANESNLIISRPNNSTAGTFTCADNETVAHAQLVLLYNFTASSSNASDDLIIGDTVSYSCQLIYLEDPFFTPIISLLRYPPIEKLDYSKSPQLEKLNSLITATATFYQTASCRSFSNILCYVQFGRPVGDLLPGSATRPISFTNYTGCPKGKVSCELSPTFAISGAALYFGAMLTCQLTSKLLVNYSWIELANGISSLGPQLTVWHGGVYQCTASFDISMPWQLVGLSTTVYNLTVLNATLSYAVKPSYGPISGGTVVTLTLENWSQEVANISAVYFADMLKFTHLQSDSDGNNAVMTTPNATAQLIGRPLSIIIEFTPGPYNISINLSFTYQGNPEITNISPSTFLVTGGTTVNVTGTQLSSVANPLIQVTLVVERGIERNATTEKSFELCRVNAEDSSHMACPMPPVNIPDDFLEVLDSQSNKRRKRDKVSMSHLRSDNQFLMSRGKRYANALSLTGPNGIDHAVIYLGFIFDGYEKYDNVNDILPDTNIHIFSPPEISFTKDIIEFDPKNDDSISIKGKHMTRGCRMVDYVVQVGADICENIDLTDNQLRCRPPKQQSQMTNNTSIYCDQLFNIYIRLGFQTYQYACMKYSARSSSTQTALIIGLVVGLSALIIVVGLVIAIVFCCKRSRNERSKSTSNTLNRNSNAPISGEYLETSAKSPTSEAYLRPAAMSHINEAYLQPSAHLYANEAYSQPSTRLYSNEPWSQPSAQLYANDD